MKTILYEDQPRMAELTKIQIHKATTQYSNSMGSKVPLTISLRLQRSLATIASVIQNKHFVFTTLNLLPAY